VKRKTLFFLLIVFLSLSLILFTSVAQGIKGSVEVKRAEGELRLIYSFPSPSVEHREDTGFDIVTISGLKMESFPGKPLMPIRQAVVLVPAGKEVERVEVVAGPKRFLGYFNLEPGRKVLPLGTEEDNSKPLPDPKVYGSTVPYPEQPLGKVSFQSKSGCSIVIANLYPLEYLPKTGAVSYYEDLTLILQLRASQENPQFVPSPIDRSVIEKMVDNPEELDGYLSLPLPGRDSQLLSGNYDYLIITNRVLAPAFSELATWRTSRGLKSTVVCVEDIYGAYPGRDSQEKIRNFLKEAKAKNGISFVLLGGDGDRVQPGDSIVPARVLYAPPVEGDCLIEVVAKTQEGDDAGSYIETYRKFRDICVNQLYKERYYYYSPVLTNLILMHPQLMGEAVALLIKYTPWVEDLVAGKQAPQDLVLTESNVKDWTDFISSLRKIVEEQPPKDGYTDLARELAGIEEYFSGAVGKSLYEAFWASPYALPHSGSGESLKPESNKNSSASGSDFTPENTTKDIASDLYYACLDGSYDGNDNGIFGEPSDGQGGGDVDLLAELYVGRAPVDSIEEARAFVEKTIAYENSKVDENRLKKVWVVGEKLDDNTWGSDYKEEIRNGSSSNGYTTVGFPSLFKVQTLYDTPNYEFSSKQAFDVLNSSSHLLNHVGHGNNDYVMRLYNADVDKLNNTGSFFFYTQACYSGSFDNRDYNDSATSDCIAEHLVDQKSGAFAMVANSRYGWYVQGSTDGPSQRFDREFWNAVFGQGFYSLGLANQASKEVNAGLAQTSDPMRYCYYEINLLGDPATQIIIPTSTSTISLTSPKGGEHWALGSQHSITWTATNLSGNLKIQLSRDGGATWPETLASSVPVSQGSWTWTVSGPVSGRCKIKLTSLSDPSIQSTSASEFTISTTVKKVAMIFAKWRDYNFLMPWQQDKWGGNIATNFAQAIERAKVECQTINKYYWENSYGEVQFDFSFFPNQGNEWVTTATPQGAYCRLKSLEKGNTLDFQEDKFVADVKTLATANLGYAESNFDITAVIHPGIPYQESDDWKDPATVAYIIASYRYDLETADTSDRLDFYGCWGLAHELGHQLGADDRYTYPPFSDSPVKNWGDLFAFDLMGDNWFRNHMSAWTKSDSSHGINWLNRRMIPTTTTTTITVPYLPSMHPGDSVVGFQLGGSTYLLDGRRASSVSGINYDRLDVTSPLFVKRHDLLQDGVAVYQGTRLSNPNYIDPWKVDKLPPQGTILNSLYEWYLSGYPTLFNSHNPLIPDAPQKDIRTKDGNGVRLTLLGDAPNGRDFLVKLEPLPSKNGKILFGAAPIAQGKGSSQVPDNMLLEAYPDLDLHAWDDQGRHVGMNYETGIYEVQIPGAEASGPVDGGEEWIFVPEGTRVTWKLSSEPVQDFCEQYPELAALGSNIYSSEVSLIHTSSGNLQASGSTSSVELVTTYSLVPGSLVEVTQTATLQGHLYCDRNGDGSFDPGEGIANATLTATPFATVTSDDGAYTLCLPTGIYGFVAEGKGYLQADYPGVQIPQPPATLTMNFALSPATPPSAPVSLTANYTGEGVQLNWSAAQAGSYPVKGYWIFRSTTPGGQDYLQPLNLELATGNTFTDTPLESGVSAYYYRVKAMDTQGNLGKPSPEAMVSLVRSLTLTSPNGGESWTIGSIKNITWISTGLTGSVKIELNRNYPSGAWGVLFSSTANDGSESWQVTGPASSSCRFRITSISDPTVFDISNGDFSIMEQGPTFAFTYPLNSGWNMISLPLVTSPSPSEVFGGLPSGWRIFSWDPTLPGYRMNEQVTLEVGEGYWLKSPGALEYTVEGTPFSGELTIPLTVGWHMIGSPYLEEVSFSEVRILSGGASCTLEEAASRGIIGRYLFLWDGSQYQIANTVGKFEPGKGYWIRARQECSLVFGGE